MGWLEVQPTILNRSSRLPLGRRSTHGRQPLWGSNLGSANVGGAVPAATRESYRKGTSPRGCASRILIRRGAAPNHEKPPGGPVKKALHSWRALLQSLWLFPSDALAQRTLQGRVVNGTTNRPVAQQRVELLTLGEGMNKNADAVSAADGSFRFTITESASSPHWLLRAIHQGVNYNLSVTPDQDLSQPVTVTIYETTQSFSRR